MDSPQIRTKRRPRNGPASSGLNAYRQLRGGHPMARKHPPEMDVGHPQLPSKVRNGAREEVPDVSHALDDMAFQATVKHRRTSSGIESMADYVGMTDVWPQRQRFRVLLALYQTNTRKNQQQAAEDLGVSLGHLRNLLYRPGRRPSLEVIQRACGLFGVPVTDFVDNPTAQVGGQDLSSQTDQARFFATVIIKDMSAEDLSDEDRQELWEDFQRGLARIRKRNARAN